MTRFEVTDIAFDFSDDLYDEEITDEYKEELREIMDKCIELEEQQ